MTGPIYSFRGRACQAIACDGEQRAEHHVRLELRPSASFTAFFAKMTPARTIVFAKFANNLFGENPLVKAAAGEFLIGGSFQDNPLIYEGVTLSPTMNSDVAVLKVSSDGSPIWVRRGSGSGYDGFDAMAANLEGDIFVATTTFLPSSFGMAGLVAESTSSKTLHLVKMDAAGNGKWIKSVSSAFDPAESNPQSSAVAYSARADSVIWAGDFAGSLNLASPVISTVAGKDVFVAKIAGDGTTSWAKSFGGTNDQFASALAVDKRGDIYVAGYFFGQITIGQTTFTSRGKEDVFVAKLREDGTPVWAKQIGYSGADRVSGLSFTRKGELLVAGWVEGGLSIDGIFLQTTGSADGFIAKFKPDGLPPVFVTQPESKVVSAGMTITVLAVEQPLPTEMVELSEIHLVGRVTEGVYGGKDRESDVQRISKKWALKKSGDHLSEMAYFSAIAFTLPTNPPFCALAWNRDQVDGLIFRSDSHRHPNSRVLRCRLNPSASDKNLGHEPPNVTSFARTAESHIGELVSTVTGSGLVYINRHWIWHSHESGEQNR